MLINTPRLMGRGGGLATVCKQQYKCHRLSTACYSSFEFQLLRLEFYKSVLGVVVYRPPKYSQVFIQEFSEFLSTILLLSDHILLVGDFNIHICCPGKPLEKEFSDLMDSFNFIQHVFGPTHEKGHTLDLVFSLGLSICDVVVNDACISDHLSVTFNVNVQIEKVEHQPSYIRSRTITQSTPQAFGDIFITLSDVSWPESVAITADPDELLMAFNTVCSGVLDSVAPYKIKHSKVNHQPWLKDQTRDLRQQCRRAERAWKKDKLMIL